MSLTVQKYMRCRLVHSLLTIIIYIIVVCLVQFDDVVTRFLVCCSPCLHHHLLVTPHQFGSHQQCLCLDYLSTRLIAVRRVQHDRFPLVYLPVHRAVSRGWVCTLHHFAHFHFFNCFDIPNYFFNL